MTRSAADIFHGARELPADQREAYLTGACGKDVALRSKVEALLKADAEAGSFLGSPAADEGAHSQEQAGAQIGRYKLLEQIGEGGMGTIWMAEQREPVKRRVALKIIKLGMDTKQVIARFEAERQALAMMDHPHIAKVLDAGATETGRPYFVMEYIKGIPILEFCDQQKIDTRARLELFTKVCHAIQHAHQKGIIHRDIKPSNVLVTLHDGVPVPKVIDFGIAKATSSELTSKTLFTEHRQMVGTPAYMSPEQAEMSGLDIDTRSDIYSLGVLLYELLTGTTPFDIKALLESGFSEMLRAIREDEPHKPSTRISSLGDTGTRTALQRSVDAKKLSTLLRGDVDWIVMKCLEKDRSRRYETANGLAADILRHLNDEPVLAGAPSAGYKLRKFVRRNRGQVLAGSAVVTALLVGVVAFAWMAKVAGEQRDRAESARAAEFAQRQLAEAARGEAEQQRALALEQAAEAARQETQARKHEREAQNQAAIAEAVAKFQTDMLAAVDPDQLPRDPLTGEPLKDRVTVVHALESAVKLLDAGSLAEQPLVEAKVRATIGATFQALARFDEAEHNLRKTLEIRRAASPVDERLVADAMDSLAMLLWQRGENDESEALMSAALEIYRRVLPAGQIDIANAMDNMAKPLVGKNKLTLAEPLLRESLALRRAILPASDTRLAHGLNGLGHLLSLQERPADAEPLYREALAINRTARPAGHPELANSINNLAACLKAQRKFEEADLLFREALAIKRATLTGDHPRLALGLNNLASSLQEQGRIAEAEPLFRDALAVWRAALPGGHQHMAMCMMNLAQGLAARGELDQASALYDEALEMCRRILPSGHPVTVQILGEYGSLQQTRGEFVDAHALQRELVELHRARADVASPEYTNNLNNLGLIELELGRTEEAAALFREALQIQRDTLRADHNDTHAVLVNLVHALRALGRKEECVSVLQDALANRRSALPAEHAQLAETIATLAFVLVEFGRLDEAEPLLHEALTLERSNGSTGSTARDVLAHLALVARARGRLDEAESLFGEWAQLQRAASQHARFSDARFYNEFALLQWERGQLAQAEALLRAALAVQRATLPAPDTNLANVLGNLGAVVLEQGRLADAEPLVVEALALKRTLLARFDPSLLNSVENLISIYANQGKSAQAASLVMELVAATRAASPEPSVERAAQLAALGTALIEMKAWADAEGVLREVLATREALQPDVWTTFNSRSQLGGILMAQGKLDEAHSPLLDGYRGMKAREASIPTQGATRIPEALERLVAFYEANGAPEEAARWRGELEAARARGAKSDDEKQR
ncbi:MAG: tetratricopeptide repeat protein [Planctomycetes bacterium]|nr:tetratricopeptide repeat protein [Planctomycetota bacterium]